jgi:hypothetical protein
MLFDLRLFGDPPSVTLEAAREGVALLFTAEQKQCGEMESVVPFPETKLFKNFKNLV